MTTVRKMSKTTLTLLAVTAVIVLFSYLCSSLFNSFFRTMKSLLGTKERIGLLYNCVVSASFWILLAASVVESIQREKSGYIIYELFIIPLVFSGLVAIWGIVGISSRISMIWFWVFYHIVMIICLRKAYLRITKIVGGGPSKVKDFIKDPLCQSALGVNIIDRKILCWTKVVLLSDYAMVIISLIILCIQYRSIFGI